jgi:hypothetical protein
VLVLAGFGGLDVGVDRACDGQVGPSCFVLVDDRGALAVVAIRAIRSFRLAPLAAAKWFPVCRRSWKCRPSAPIARTACAQAAILLKLLRRSGPPLTPGKTSASASRPTNRDRCSRTAGMIDEGIPTMRQAALDFGGPSTSSPVDRSAYAERTRTVRRGRAYQGRTGCRAGRPGCGGGRHRRSRPSFSRWAWTGPNDGAVSVVNTHGWVATVSGMPLPPDSPARMSW